MDLEEALRAANVPLEPGMATTAGRVVAVDDGSAVIWDGTAAVPAGDALLDLTDRATRLLALDLLAARTGLDAEGGLLWYIHVDEGGPTWVLEGTDETRYRPGDTEDPLLALARGLAETA